MKNTLKKMVLIAGIGLMAKGLALPSLVHVDLSNSDNWNKYSEIVPKETGADEYNPKFQGDDESVALSYLKLAHAITSKHMDYQENPNLSIEDKITQGVGDCSEYTRFTYTNFIHLINRDNKPELAKYVRLARGIVNQNNGNTKWSCLVRV